MNRKRWIVGLASLAVLMMLVMVAIGFLLSRLRTPPQAHQRKLVSALAYCDSNNHKPCIVSFSLDADGNMLINIVTSSASYPDFYLTISNTTTENKYVCQSVADFPTNIYCTGAEMYPGEILQFTLHAMEDDTVLADGKFAIIGLQLPNPADEVTATPSTFESPAVTEPPFETPTPLLLDFPTQRPTLEILVTATPTPTVPAYPDYPNYP